MEGGGRKALREGFVGAWAQLEAKDIKRAGDRIVTHSRQWSALTLIKYLQSSLLVRALITRMPD